MWMESVVKDLRIAARAVARRPWFSFAVISSLALGIGANVAVFSLLDALLLRRLPVARPSELVRVIEENRANLTFVR